MNLTNKNLSSKTGALVLLNKKLKFKKYRIPKFIYFSKKNFLKNKDKIFQNIKKKFKKGIIIRSSSLSEDLENMSNAGKFKSFSDKSYWIKKNNIALFFKENLFKYKKNLIIIIAIIFVGFLFLF